MSEESSTKQIIKMISALSVSLIVAYHLFDTASSSQASKQLIGTHSKQTLSSDIRMTYKWAMVNSQRVHSSIHNIHSFFQSTELEWVSMPYKQESDSLSARKSVQKHICKLYRVQQPVQQTLQRDLCIFADQKNTFHHNFFLIKTDVALHTPSPGSHQQKSQYKPH